MPIAPPTAAPGAAAPGGPQPQPQQAPFGSSPATGPTPNKGYEAAAMQRVGVLVKQMSEILPLVGATSELGRALMKSMTDLGKHVPPGSTDNVAERNAIEKMALQNQRNGQMAQQLRAQPSAQGAAPPQPMPAVAQRAAA